MNKLSKLMMGLAALSFAACSSDEPTPTPTPDDGEGTTMYLNVNITDANNARSRAAGYEQDGTPTDPADEGDYVFGSTDEHAVNSADFFFFDAQGRYVTRANVWQAASGTDVPNIEYMGANTLVLRNLTKENLPTWVITVLNAPSGFADEVEANNYTMEQLAKRPFSIRTGDYFVMSTTSFYDAEDTDRSDNNHYYATKLKASDFMTEVPTQVAANAVDIYVERLAAKFQITGLNEDGVFPVEVTVAGEPNTGDSNVEEGGIPSASTKLYVKILGYGLTGQEKESNLSKNLDGLDNADFLWDNWNHPAFFRSYWGKSVSYGETDPDLGYTTFAEANNSVANAIYGFETTNTAANIRNSNNELSPNLVTNVIFTAKVFADADCNTPVDLVEYNGVYFTKDQYMKYVLGKLLASNGLKYWTNENIEGTTTLPDGTTQNIYTYDPLTIDDFTCDWTAANQGTGTIVIKYTPAEGVTLYKNGEGWQEGDKKDEASADDVNAELAKFNEQSTATAFNNGAMFYSVPVEHLLGKDQSTNYKVENEGEYGVVRNHWYQINVNKVVSLGHGVFQPDGDNAEEIIPDDNKKERFALAAQINILSWKIVQQSVDL